MTAHSIICTCGGHLCSNHLTCIFSSLLYLLSEAHQIVFKLTCLSCSLCSWSNAMQALVSWGSGSCSLLALWKRVHSVTYPMIHPMLPLSITLDLFLFSIIHKLGFSCLRVLWLFLKRPVISDIKDIKERGPRREDQRKNSTKVQPGEPLNLFGLLTTQRSMSDSKAVTWANNESHIQDKILEKHQYSPIEDISEQLWGRLSGPLYNFQKGRHSDLLSLVNLPLLSWRILISLNFRGFFFLSRVNRCFV